MGQTLAQKVYEQHVVRRTEGEPDLLYIDLHLVHEVTSPQAFDGLRAAGREFSPHTLVILKEMELLYDSSLMADDAPYELLNDGEPTGVVELPPEWIRDDAAYFAMHRMTALRPYAPLAAVEEVFVAEFEGAWAEGGLFLLTLHPHLIGQRARLPLLQRLLRHIRARGGSWFGTHEQVARWCLARAPALADARAGAGR